MAESGEKELSNLLKNMDPCLNSGNYVFCSIPPEQLDSVPASQIVALVRESSEVSLVLSETYANNCGIAFKKAPPILSWITLKVHSSLEAIGLTAAFSRALTEVNISCNVIAGFHHDHIFVPIQDSARAMQTLRKLSQTST